MFVSYICPVFSVMSDSGTPWTVARQVPLSIGFPSKDTGVSCHFFLQGNFPGPGIESRSLASPGRWTLCTGIIWEALLVGYMYACVCAFLYTYDFILF